MEKTAVDLFSLTGNLWSDPAGNEIIGISHCACCKSVTTAESTSQRVALSLGLKDRMFSIKTKYAVIYQTSTCNTLTLLTRHTYLLPA